MAGIIKRRNTWFALWRENGQQVRKTTGVHVKPMPGDGACTPAQLKKLAQITADSMEAAAKGAIAGPRAMEAVRAAWQGMSVKKAKTLQEWAHEWLETQRKKKTFESCRRIIRKFLEMMGKNAEIPLHAVTAGMIQDWMTERLDQVSGSTVDREMAEISALFNRAVADSLIDKNPARGCRLPAWALHENVERDAFTLDQLKVILKKFPGEWPDMVIVCLLLGGLRLGEVAMLKWSQFDFERMLCHVRTEKTKRAMFKPILPTLQQILEKRKRQGLMVGSEFVFPYAAARVRQAGGKTVKLSVEFGKYLDDHKLRMSRADRVKLIGEPKSGRMISELSFHSLRTTAVTFLICGGCPPEMVRLIIGHDDPRIEGKHYFKPSLEQQAEAMAFLSDLVAM